MEKKTYSCDKCKKEKPLDKLKSVVIARCKSRQAYLPGSSSQYQECVFIDLCTACQQKLGFVELVLNEDKIEAKQQDTKEKLYDVMCDLIDEIGIPMQQ